MDYTSPRSASRGNAPSPAVARHWPPQDEAIRTALLTAFASGDWGRYHGEHMDRLTQQLGALCGTTHAYPVCSGTFATELALRMLQVGPGDEVVLAGYDFPGNFRAIEAVGARPVLSDVAPGSWLADPEQIAAAASPQVKAVVVSHLHGCLAPLPEIMAIAGRHGWKVIEDACQMPGAMCAGRPTGSWGDIGTLSFGGSKLLTAGRGGAIVTSSPQLYQRAKIICEQGNHAYPLSELQAAVLLPQLTSLAERNRQRTAAVGELFSRFHERMGEADPGSISPIVCADHESSPAYYKLGWMVRRRGAETAEELTARRDELSCVCQQAGLSLDAGFRGFASRSTNRCRKTGELANASFAAAATLVMHHPVLLETKATLHTVADQLAEISRRFAEQVP